MDFESPDVEKDFPGLYASESGRKSNESDFSDGAEHEKPSKKDLLGRRKEKKESKKDRGYAALEGESSPEEDTDTKSPSKSKKTKSFKFPTKSKEKREKSRDKEKVLEETVKHKEVTEKDKKKEKEREKEKKEKEKKKEKDKEKEEKAKFKFESREKLKDEKKEKVKDKDKEKSKEKEKEKVKEKDKDKKDKKLTKIPSTVTSGVPFEEIFTLGVALPIFGVPLQQSVERSRCHDDTGLPLVVRDSIDYLQAHGLKSKDIYRTEPDKIKFQQLRKLFTDRGPTFPYHWDVPVACAMLKAFISELPESILTQELHGQFEQATAIAEPQREATMTNLINKLPNCNHNLLAWLMRHFHHVVSNEQVNQANIQTIMAAMGAALNMSLNLLTYLVTKSEKLFPNVRLTKYVPPLHSLPADFPDSAAEMSAELRKQESLLSQIHAEMHAGFITAARDQQLWEAQRIVTQLKRKLRSVQKSTEPNAVPTQQSSVDEKQPDEETTRGSSQPTEAEKPVREVERPVREVERPVREVERPVREVERPVREAEKPVREAERPVDAFEPKESPLDQDATFEAEFEDNFDFKPDKKTTTVETQATEPIPDKPKLTEKELKVLRLELENAEYLQLKSLLQAKINSEQFEIVKLRSYVALKNKQECNLQNNKDAKENSSVDEQELKQRLMKENALLEQKRLNLINQIFQERVACIQLKIELAMKEILSKS
ncbi:ralA-binding protein 1 isoform X2 [Bombyx mandarina]|uniref:RalA-binding protein 1 isoform X2 n=1 Tax=Bombyx mandarina TaxID=7092 RepID=A0A6J2KDN6_BOMMA|nr:ralA-binding protein 1 isoform X2 [Bombyx mandarina]